MTAKKRGLGRGLDALLGSVKIEPPSEKERDKLKTLPVEFMRSSRFQPRKDFDPERLQELADSISSQGVVQPIVVREVAENRYEIIAGERRWRAAQMAGLHDIPVVIREVPDQAALAIALIENIQRQDLNPLEEAEALKRLLEDFSLTHQQVADAVGKSRAAVSNLMRLNELHPDAKALLVSGDIEMGHARAILGLAHERQGVIAAQVAARHMNVRETEALVRKLQDDAQTSRQNRQQDPDITRFAEQITEKLGARVQIQHSSKGAGKLIISYDSLDQLEGVIERLG